jgi:D-sedoheptulose 7-phosphate isomerase
MQQENYKYYLDKVAEGAKNLDQQALKAAENIILNCKKQNGIIFFVGNGGSASIASHVATDFTKAAKIQAMTFNDSNFITCYGNDYGYENWVAEAVKSHCKLCDVIVLISSSGCSPNIINAAVGAKSMGIKVITLSGFSEDNSLKKLGDINLWVDSDNYNVIEMVHHQWLLAIVENVSSIKS